MFAYLPVHVQNEAWGGTGLNLIGHPKYLHIILKSVIG